MQRILVATDFSARSDRAIRRAVLLAREAGADICLVHVVDDDQPRRIVDAEVAAASAVLGEQAGTLREIDGVHCAHRVTLGDPFEGIARAATEVSPDLLVIGQYRRRVLQDIFVGTTAERTLRASQRPVLVANGVPAGAYRNILFAVDLTPCAGEVLRAAMTLTLHRQAILSVLHVFEAPATSLMARAPVTREQVTAYVLEEERRARQQLAAFLADANLAPAQAIVRQNDSSAAAVISATAQGLAADLLVIGTQSGGIAKRLLGSVAEEILRTSEIDVLAVPPREI